MKTKNNMIASILLIVGVLFVISGFLFLNSDKEVKINGEIILEDAKIQNQEIENLYSYVSPYLYSSNVCLGFFYQNPFENHDLDDKISLLLISYGEQFKKAIDDDFLNKIKDKNERNKIENTSFYYIEVEVIEEAMKLIFNISLDDYKFDQIKDYYRYRYIKDANAFVDTLIDEEYKSQVLQQIIDYNETSSEINLTVVKTEIVSDSKLNGAYRYANKKDTLVIKDITDEEFYFTKENINKFPQVKYIFKKNKDGKYYVSDIVNLNFFEDFEKCN